MFRKMKLAAAFLAIGLFCFPQLIHAETRTILSNGKIKLTDGTNTATLNAQGHQRTTQDNQTLVLNRYAAKFHGHTTTLSVAASAGDTSISIQAGDYAEFAVEDRLFINFGILEENNYPIITVKPGSPVLTLNKPLDKSYSIGTDVQHIVIDASGEVGTLAAPISFKIQPPSGITYNLRQAVAVIEMDLAGDSSKFGDITGGLTNGVITRAKINGVTNTRTTIRTNLDLEDDTAIDVKYNQRAPGGKFGVIITYDFGSGGVYIPLNGTNGDFFEVLIQDDISSLNIVRVKFHGYITIN